MHSLVVGTEDHARAIVPLMSDFDRGELEALSGDAVGCLVGAVWASIICRCALINGQPAFLGGALEDGRAWMVSTPAVAGARKFYLRTTRAVMEEMQTLLPMLWTQIDTRYCRSLRWAEWLGFTVGSPMVWGDRTVRPIMRCRYVE